MGLALGLADVPMARRELTALGGWDGARPAAPSVGPATLPAPGAGEAVLATWHWLLDAGRMQVGDAHLAGTAKQPRVHLSAATAAAIGAEPGDTIVVGSDAGSIALPLVIADLPDRVVWVPTNSPGAPVRRLAVPAGSVVRIARRTTSTLLGEAS
jgi:NADH-quinone oxidoreductase subunit G